MCPSEHPYFNLEYKMCQKCSEGTKYEEAHHECLTTQGNIATQVPTLEKMAAGIFSWSFISFIFIYFVMDFYNKMIN